MKRRRLPVPNAEWPPPTADEPEVALFNLPRSPKGGTNVIDVNSASRLDIRTKPVRLQAPITREAVETAEAVEAVEAVEAPQAVVLEGSLDDFPLEQAAPATGPLPFLELDLAGRTDESAFEHLTEAAPPPQLPEPAAPPLPPSLPAPPPLLEQPRASAPSIPTWTVAPSARTAVPPARTAVPPARTAVPSARTAVPPARTAVPPPALKTAAPVNRYRAAGVGIGIATIALAMFFVPLLLKRVMETRAPGSSEGSATLSTAPEAQPSEAARAESEPPAAPAVVAEPPLDRGAATSGDTVGAPVTALGEAALRPEPPAAGAVTPASPPNRGPAGRLADREAAPSAKQPLPTPTGTRAAAAPASPAPPTETSRAVASAPAPIELRSPPDPTPIVEPPAAATIGEAPRPEPPRAETPRADATRAEPPAAEPRAAESIRTDSAGESPRAVAAPSTKEVTASEGMAAALKRLQLAYSRRDAALVKEVWPSVDERALARAFEGLRSQSVTFDRCETRVTAPTGEMQCHGVTTYVPRFGGQAQRSESRQWRFRMEKNGENWVIDSVTARE